MGRAIRPGARSKEGMRPDGPALHGVARCTEGVPLSKNTAQLAAQPAFIWGIPVNMGRPNPIGLVFKREFRMSNEEFPISMPLDILHSLLDIGYSLLDLKNYDCPEKTLAYHP
jgi:hypothetical protein